LVEDDKIMGESLCYRFALEGFQVDWCQNAETALDSIRSHHPALVISDIRLPGQCGEALFGLVIKQIPAPPPFIFITGFASTDNAVHLLKLGAADYISKPFDLDQLVEKVRALYQIQAILPSATPGVDSIGISPAMKKIQEAIPRLAKQASVILISGESGVGKEYVAQQIHHHARDEIGLPFVAVNCGALAESLLEAELFGYEKGAFTGAARAHKGVFEQAHGGTLFLDEIGDMPMPMQVKLLRALQERRITRVGGEASIPVDVRLVCATHRDLRTMVLQGLFREDLYYRVHVIHLRIPPLRERKEDILWFTRIFLREFAAEHGGQKRILHPLAQCALLEHAWPGNLRELKYCVERACILSRQPLLEPGVFFDDGTRPPHLPDAPAEDELAVHLRECERKHILLMLARSDWHLGHTAAKLSISRKTLWEKMKKLKIHAPQGAATMD